MNISTILRGTIPTEEYTNKEKEYRTKRYHNRTQTVEPSVTITETQLEGAIRELLNRKPPGKDNIKKKSRKFEEIQLTMKLKKLFHIIIEKRSIRSMYKIKEVKIGKWI